MRRERVSPYLEPLVIAARHPEVLHAARDRKQSPVDLELGVPLVPRLENIPLQHARRKVAEPARGSRACTRVSASRGRGRGHSGGFGAAITRGPFFFLKKEGGDDVYVHVRKCMAKDYTNT